MRPCCALGRLLAVTLLPAPIRAIGPFTVCRLTITASNGGPMLQLGDMDLVDKSGVLVPIAGAAAACYSPPGEGASFAVDGTPSTKWLCLQQNTGTLEISLAGPTMLNSYELYTANDAPLRDPVSWQLECGMDASSFTTLDTVHQFQPPLARLTGYGTMAFAADPPPEPPSPPTPPSPPIPPPLAPPSAGAAAGPFTHCRLVVRANNGNSLLQLGDINFRGAALETLSVASALAPCFSPHAERAIYGADGTADTKWLCLYASTSTLTVTFSAPSLVRGYELYTANDEPTRDPTSWRIECGADTVSYEILSEVSSFQPPFDRFTSYGLMTFALPPGAPPQPPFPPGLPGAPPSPPLPPSPPPDVLMSYTVTLSFDDAEAFCVARLGHLPVVHSVAENSRLSGICPNGCWLGLHDTVTEGVWQWNDNSTLQFTHWAPGEPNGQPHERTAAHMYGNGDWDDDHTYELKPVICQIAHGMFPPLVPPAPPPPPIFPVNFIVNGSCVVSGNCIQSSGYPAADYRTDEVCTASNLPKVPTEVEAFDVEYAPDCGYDSLTIDGDRYCGSSGPTGVTPTDGTMTWISDSWVGAPGWRICFTPPHPPAAAASPPPSTPPPVAAAQQSCVCGSDPARFSTHGSATACFGANDITNLEVMFANLPIAADVTAFYTRCADYNNDGAFRANDLTNMKQYYAGLLPIAAYLSGGG